MDLEHQIGREDYEVASKIRPSSQRASPSRK